MHFLVMCGYLAFIIAHVSMVAISGFVRNVNHIVVGKDYNSFMGVYLGVLGLLVLLAINIFANWASWKWSRTVQHFSAAVLNPIFSHLLDRYATRTEYTPSDISPYFWAQRKAADLG